MEYSVYLLNESGQGSYLSVKGKTSWKTKKVAQKHCADIKACKKMPWNTVECFVENQFGEAIK